MSVVQLGRELDVTWPSSSAARRRVSFGRDDGDLALLWS